MLFFCKILLHKHTHSYHSHQTQVYIDWREKNEDYHIIAFSSVEQEHD
jgi:hypothetical protein